MSSARSGILAMIGACAIWGLSPIFYRQLAAIPPWEVLAHRALWSLILFAGILWIQGRLGEVRAGFSDGRRARRTVLAGTFGVYGAIKKTLPLGLMVSVVAEILVFLPLALGVLVVMHAQGIGAFGPERWRESLLLILSGPITALPMILFSFAARRVAMSTVGLLQYINPSLQFLCAIMVFGEVLTPWHGLAFPMIWTALAVYSLASLR